MGAGEPPVATAPLGSGRHGTYETEAFLVQAPTELGAHGWRLQVRASTDEGQEHLANQQLPPFHTEAHRTSVAVWDVQSPAVTGQPLSVKIGVKCAEECRLGGVPVEVLDESSGKLASARLREEIWEGSNGLHWAEVELSAPEDERVVSWQARLSAAGLELPHESSASTFGFAVTSPPRHRLAVEVLESGSGVPVPRAEVSLGIYRGSTDSHGRATLAVADGAYELIVWKAGYDAPSRPLVVSDDLTVRVEAELLPDTSEWEDD